jgi:hypothetical protein
VIGGWTYLLLIGVWKLIGTSGSKSWMCSSNQYVIPIAFGLAAIAAVVTILAGKIIDDRYSGVLTTRYKGWKEDLFK